MKANSALSVALAAGCVSSVAMAADTRQAVQGVPALHIYYHVASGEVTITPIGETAPGARGATDVWAGTFLSACNGTETADNLSLDDPINTWGFGTFAGSAVADWGDIPADSAVDCMTINYSVGIHPDDNAIGAPTPISGFARRITIYERDNGFNETARTPLLTVTLLDLLSADGALDETVSVFYVSVFFVTVDLAGSGFTFELGDSDGDSQGMDLFNSMIFISGLETGPGVFDGIPSDLDGDGYSDFSYFSQFLQPGGWDLDGDGIPDQGVDDGAGGFVGSQAEQRPGAIQQIYPDGVSSYDSLAGAWVITSIAGPPAAQGIEDAFDIFWPYEPSMDNISLTTNNLGTFWFGGYACDGQFDGPDGLPNTTDDVFTSYNIMAAGHLGLLNNASPCPADITGDGVLDVFDVFAFLAAYDNGACSGAVGDWNGDGVCDVFDVFGFLGDYDNGNGCP